MLHHLLHGLNATLWDVRPSPGLRHQQIGQHLSDEMLRVRISRNSAHGFPSLAVTAFFRGCRLNIEEPSALARPPRIRTPQTRLGTQRQEATAITMILSECCSLLSCLFWFLLLLLLAVVVVYLVVSLPQPTQDQFSMLENNNNAIR